MANRLTERHDGMLTSQDVQRLLQEGRISQQEAIDYYKRNPDIAEGLIQGNPERGLTYEPPTPAELWEMVPEASERPKSNYDDIQYDPSLHWRELLRRLQEVDTSQTTPSPSQIITHRPPDPPVEVDPRDMEEQAGVVAGPMNSAFSSGLARNPYDDREPPRGLRRAPPAGLGRNPYGDNYGVAPSDPAEPVPIEPEPEPTPLQDQIQTAVTSLQEGDETRMISPPSSRGAGLTSAPPSGGTTPTVTTEKAPMSSPEGESRWDRARSGLRGAFGIDDDADISSLKLALIAAGGGLASGSNWSEGLGNAMQSGTRTYIAADSSKREADARDEALDIRREQNEFDQNMSNRRLALQERDFALKQRLANTTDPIEAAKLKVESLKLQQELNELENPNPYAGLKGDLGETLQAIAAYAQSENISKATAIEELGGIDAIFGSDNPFAGLGLSGG